MIKEKIEPRLIDVAYVDSELEKLFASVPHGRADETFLSHKNRFERQQRIKAGEVFSASTRTTLSLAKKLEILCTYGNHYIVKMDKRHGIGQANVDKHDKMSAK